MTQSGYTDCACRDCFDVAISSDMSKPELCGLCAEAGCYAEGSEEFKNAPAAHYRECQRPDAYGVDCD